MEKVKIRFCPRCGETDLVMTAGGITGEWRCKKCNYVGSVFPEKAIKKMQKRT